MEEPVEKYYQMRAKDIVDLLFDKNFLRDDVSRDDMQKMEDFIAWSLQSQSRMAVKCALLSKSRK